jgi:Holliday junction DNA helicase RuvA
MISRISGLLLEGNLNRVVVDCHGVGYGVLVPESIYSSLPDIGGPVSFYTRQIFREDTQFLVGFIEDQDRQLFDLLTEVKGCGPKIALAVIGDLGSGTTLNAIATEDPKTLSKASGVGPRLAERIILELKEKVRNLSFSIKVAGVNKTTAVVSITDDLVEALLALGYKRQEAEASALEFPEGDLNERLRQALRKSTL